MRDKGLVVYCFMKATQPTPYIISFFWTSYNFLLFIHWSVAGCYLFVTLSSHSHQQWDRAGGVNIMDLNCLCQVSSPSYNLKNWVIESENQQK